MKKSYSQKEKNIVRNDALETAVKYLTTERNNVTIASHNYLRDLKEACIKQYGSESPAFFLSDETICRWEKFYSATIGKKTNSELRVAYLCGPNPLNDLSIFIKQGILPENVWAFENNDAEYNEAKITTLNSKYPYLKIVRQKIGDFFESTPLKFDIIYLDFCGPLSDVKGENIKTLTSIFKNHVLTSLGILITNFSFPTKEQCVNTFDSLTKITASYLFPKHFLESDELDSNIDDGAEVNGIISSIKDYEYFEYNEETKTEEKVVEKSFLNEVLKKPEWYYGQFITRFLFDIASIIIPGQRFFSEKNRAQIKMFFDGIYENQSFSSDFSSIINRMMFISENDQRNSNEEDNRIEELIDDMEILKDPIVCAFNDIFLYSKEEKNRYFSNFVDSLRINRTDKIPNNLLFSLIAVQFLLTQSNTQLKYYSDNLKKLHTLWDIQAKTRYFFCDDFLFHQGLELLVRQLMVPYHFNLEKTKRWTYKAKETQMFCDLILYDECRYLYDWIPTLDMFTENLSDLDMEISLRFILDAISKHNRYFSMDVYFGTSVIGTSTHNFEAKQLSKRIVIN